jgi:hypothetical protein
MNPVLRNILAVVAGVVIGGAVNLGIVMIGMAVYPLPEGTDVSNMESIRAVMSTLPPINFIFPLLAHAAGTFVGAWIAARFAASHPMKLALCVGVVFLAGGIGMILNCGGPAWFIATDLVLAYLPMAAAGGALGRKKKA